MKKKNLWLCLNNYSLYLNKDVHQHVFINLQFSVTGIEVKKRVNLNGEQKYKHDENSIVVPEYIKSQNLIPSLIVAQTYKTEGELKLLFSSNSGPLNSSKGC